MEKIKLVSIGKVLNIAEINELINLNTGPLSEGTVLINRNAGAARFITRQNINPASTSSRINLNVERQR